MEEKAGGEEEERCLPAFSGEEGATAISVMRKHKNCSILGYLSAVFPGLLDSEMFAVTVVSITLDEDQHST